jgi:hypothetical protein
MTASELLDWQHKANVVSKTMSEFKEVGRELRDKYNLTDLEAINLLNNVNVLEIMAKIEKETRC